MGRRKKENPLDYINLPSVDMHPEVKKAIFALTILAIAIISGLGLIDQAGAFGTYLKQSLTWLLGWGRWIIPPVFLTWSFFIFFKERFEIKVLHYLGLILICFSILSLMQLSIPQIEWPVSLVLGQGGGHLGYWLASSELKAIGLIAAFVISFFVGLIGLMFVLNSGLAVIFEKLAQPFKFIINPFKKMMSLMGIKSADKDDSSTSSEQEEEDEDESAKDEEEEEEQEEDEEEGEEDEEEDKNDDEDEEEASEPQFDNKPLPIYRVKNDEAVNIWKPSGVRLNLSLDLLDNRTSRPKSGDIKECSQIIQNTLSNFGINVEMGEVCVGPTVTQYTLRPADGVKLSKIIGLQTNLAMALAAQQLRIEAPIPGQALVGIEVPNRVIATIGLREIIESEQFKSKGSKLTFALGKDVTGKSWATTINSMPHLLVAGQTGSGKSVMINSIIISLLFNNNPDDLRFIMIDPKRVELTPYNGIPHLLIPVITDASKTVNALKWTINEMERRLKLLEKFKKKDIVSFNQTAKVRLPYIVFIIDELADLMMLAGKEAEPGIVRIAQMARAVGIHLILATQRPSVNVITGLIKANMPARIAFAVASGIDSKTILDGSGAEKLLGRGDMLFTSASMSKPKRIQGPLVTEKEIKRIVNEIKRQAGEPEYLEGVTDKQRLSGSMGIGMGGATDGDDEDDRLEEARDLIIQTRKASTTMLQRHLGLGYARAAKLIDILERQGVISPSNGSKPREVLISEEQYAAGMTMVSIPLHNQASSKAPEEYLDEVESEMEEVEEVDEENEDENLDDSEDDNKNGNEEDSEADPSTGSGQENDDEENSDDVEDSESDDDNDVSEEDEDDDSTDQELEEEIDNDDTENSESDEESDADASFPPKAEAPKKKKVSNLKNKTNSSATTSKTSLEDDDFGHFFAR